MNTSFTFLDVGGYRSLVHKQLFENGIKHAFVTNQLNLKDTDLGVPFELHRNAKLSLAKQTHSTIHLTSAQFGMEGDAFIVKTGESAGVRTADCVPLVLINIRNRRIGAVIHAGWLGACTGIVENTLDELTSLGHRMEDFVALIGPSALSCCYEVQDDVASRFSSGVETREGRTFLSVTKYVVDVLLKAGISKQNLECADICTICSNDFYSHRRDGNKAGRFLSFLSLG